jgi:hypothetical protein
MLTLERLRESQVFAGHDELMEMIVRIDAEEIGLDNEREVKRIFVEALRYTERHQLSL